MHTCSTALVSRFEVWCTVHNCMPTGNVLLKRLVFIYIYKDVNPEHSYCVFLPLTSVHIVNAEYLCILEQDF